MLLIAKKEPQTRPIGVADAQLLLGAVAGLNDVALRVQLETIALLAERYKVSSVARVARRRLNGR